MNPEDTDRQFHENLLAMGREGECPAEMSDGMRAACEAALRSEQGVGSRRTSALRRPALLSTLGIAAAIALLVGFFYLPSGNHEVNAATVLARLNDQIERSSRIDVLIENLAVEELFVNGNLAIMETGVAGDIQATVDRGDEGTVELDLTLGLCEKEAWVLIRKLKVPDPQAMAMLSFFLNPNSETLLKLPSDELDFGEEFDTHLFMGDQITEVIREVIASASQIGATVEEQPDGTVLLTLPIKDAASLDSLRQLESLSGKNGVQIGMGIRARHAEEVVSCHDDLRSKIESDEPHAGIRIDVSHVEDDVDMDIDQDSEAILYGVTLEVVYDPAKDAVRSLVIDNIGEAKGRVSVTTRECATDPAIFDASRVMTDRTRVLDLGALKKTFEAFDRAASDEEETQE